MSNKILKEVMELNPSLTYKDLCCICDKSESTVFKWLNDSLNIDDISIYRLNEALVHAKLNVPRSLCRLKSKLTYNARYWANKNKSGNKKAVLIGDKKIEQVRYSLTYKNKTITLERASEILGYNKDYTAKILKSNSIHPTDDITDFIDNYVKPKRGRKS